MQSKCVETLVGQLRRDFEPRIPTLIESLSAVEFSVGQSTSSVAESKEIERVFPRTYGQPVVDIGSKNVKLTSMGQPKHSLESSPHIEFTQSSRKIDTSVLRVGVVLSGGQAPGGHNVITALFDALKELNQDSVLLGFTGGPKGVVVNRYIELTADVIGLYRNTGGFDMLKSGREKFKTQLQLEASLKTVTENKLDGLVVIGGDGSNTYAALLAEFFAQHNSKCKVVGVPKTIDGDLQNEYIEMSFGFDTAVKTFSEMISNLCRDAVSAAKTWHFVKLMGRDASHVTLDCALQTQVNIALIGEEIQSEKMLLHDVTEHMVDVIEARALQGKNYGVVLIPEGVIQFIPTMKVLIHFLNDAFKEGSEHLIAIDKLFEVSDKIKYVRELLKRHSQSCLANFEVLPRDIQAQLLLERDNHGNIQLSQVPIEQLFIQICEQKLRQRGKYIASKTKFRGQGHFFGYDGRSCFPSNFDAQYCYALGRVSALLIAAGLNGYMARVYDLELDVKQWRVGAIPITMMMNIEIRHGQPTPVIKKCLVDVDHGSKFAYFLKRRDEWAVEDCYRYVGPIQFFGPTALTDCPPMNVLLKKTNDIKWPIHDASGVTPMGPSSALAEKANANLKLVHSAQQSYLLWGIAFPFPRQLPQLPQSTTNTYTVTIFNEFLY